MAFFNQDVSFTEKIDAYSSVSNFGMYRIDHSIVRLIKSFFVREDESGLYNSVLRAL